MPAAENIPQFFSELVAIVFFAAFFLKRKRVLLRTPAYSNTKKPRTKVRGVRNAVPPEFKGCTISSRPITRSNGGNCYLAAAKRRYIGKRNTIGGLSAGDPLSLNGAANRHISFIIADVGIILRAKRFVKSKNIPKNQHFCDNILSEMFNPRNRRRVLPSYATRWLHHRFRRTFQAAYSCF